jgi:hypothetical protein
MQGSFLSEIQIRRIISLLSTTEMTIPQIAERMQCSRSAVASLNRKFQVREYQGRRSCWTLKSAQPLTLS